MKIEWIGAIAALWLVSCGSDSKTSFPDFPEGGIDGSSTGGELNTGGRASGGRSAGGQSGDGGGGSGGVVGADAAADSEAPMKKDAGPPEASAPDAATDACGGCHATAICDESGSEPECACPSGTVFADGPTSECVDACAASPCGDGAVCVESDGGFACACDEGYMGDGETCDDIDECATNAHDCHANAACTNTDGGFACGCDSGYEGDGVDCTDIDECVTNTHDCHANAACTNTDGSFTCACDRGFQGNGRNCADIDECARGTDNCDDIASCENTPGSFTCTCPSGRTGNGRRCRCDLSGTWAVEARFSITYDPVPGLLAGGQAETQSWAIRHHTQSGADISVETRACGATAPDICGATLLAGQAFAQAFGPNIWDLASMPLAQSAVSLTADSLPDPTGPDPFVGPLEVSLLGLDLSNPAGAWPPSHTGARITWQDHDGDTHDGLTSTLRSTGTSSSCGGAAYAYLPNPDPAVALDTALDPDHPQRVAEVWVGSRALASYTGTISEDCGTITGVVEGPDSGMPRLNGHITGCVLANGNPCTATTVNELDSAGQDAGQTITATSFTMVRVQDSDLTCSEVRAMNFPAP